MAAFAALLDGKYSKNGNIAKYDYNLLLHFNIFFYLNRF